MVLDVGGIRRLLASRSHPRHLRANSRKGIAGPGINLLHRHDSNRRGIVRRETSRKLLKIAIGIAIAIRAAPRNSASDAPAQPTGSGGEIA